MKLAAVVPAAGLSRRMGREKILLPFRGSTILETILQTLDSAGVSTIVAVVRPDLPEAAERARREGAIVVTNPHPDEKMLLSIQLGLAALPPELDAVFVWPADHPAVLPATVHLLARAADPARALLPTYLSRRGHPVLIGRKLLPEIARIPMREGLRRLWRTRPDAVLEVSVEDPGIVRNIDTPSDYRDLIGPEPVG